MQLFDSLDGTLKVWLTRSVMTQGLRSQNEEANHQRLQFLEWLNVGNDWANPTKINVFGWLKAAIKVFQKNLSPPIFPVR